MFYLYGASFTAMSQTEPLNMITVITCLKKRLRLKQITLKNPFKPASFDENEHGKYSKRFFLFIFLYRIKIDIL